MHTYDKIVAYFLLQQIQAINVAAKWPQVKCLGTNKITKSFFIHTLF